MSDEMKNSASVDPTKRNLLMGAGAAALLSASASNVAFATSHSKHTGHIANPTLTSAAQDCLKTGQSCLSHCFESFKAGDASLATCAASVQETLSVCTSLVELGSYNSNHLASQAKVCVGVCEDCAKECEKHAAEHQACKACGEACQTLVEEAKKLAA